APRPRRPLVRAFVRAQAGQLLPGLAGVARLEERRILDARVYLVGIRQRWLDMPDALELPRMRRAVVPLVCARRPGVLEVVAGRLPGLASVVRSSEDLAEPAARLRRVEAVGVRRRSLDAVDLPAPKVRSLDLPALAAGVRGQDEGALASAHEYANSAHLVHPCQNGWTAARKRRLRQRLKLIG